jgi:hypothetical protein
VVHAWAAGDAAVAAADPTRLKHDIVLLGHFDNGIGFYRFVYNGGETAYVGVQAQDVEAAVPEAVTRGRDGYLRVAYHRLGVPFRELRSLGRVGRANPARHAALSSANGRGGYRPAPSACSAARMTV